MCNSKYNPWFQASTGGLGMCFLWMRADYSVQLPVGITTDGTVTLTELPHAVPSQLHFQFLIPGNH